MKVSTARGEVFGRANMLGAHVLGAKAEADDASRHAAQPIYF